MAAPAVPTVASVGATLNTYTLNIEISQADFATLTGTTDGRKEIGSVTPAGFTNAQKITVSRLQQVMPS